MGDNSQNPFLAPTCNLAIAPVIAPLRYPIFGIFVIVKKCPKTPSADKGGSIRQETADASLN